MQLSAHGTSIPEELIGTLKSSAALLHDADALREGLDADGYLYLPGAIARDDVIEARRVILEALVGVGELVIEGNHAISTGTSERGEKVDDLGAFWQSLCEHPALRKVTHSGAIVEIMNRIFAATVRSFDFLWLRAMHPGRASAYHFDHVYMNRGSDQLLTVWTPLGDVALNEGPLALVENSHRWDDVIAEFRGFDVDRDRSRPGHVTLDPVPLVRERGTRLLTAEFKAGDVAIFPMFTLHGSLDNISRENHVRLSADTRFQPASHLIDERWIGKNPVGHGGGYGAMSGARPATAAPLHR